MARSCVDREINRLKSARGAVFQLSMPVFLQNRFVLYMYILSKRTRDTFERNGGNFNFGFYYTTALRTQNEKRCGRLSERMKDDESCEDDSKHKRTRWIVATPKRTDGRNFGKRSAPSYFIVITVTCYRVRSLRHAINRRFPLP